MMEQDRDDEDSFQFRIRWECLLHQRHIPTIAKYWYNDYFVVDLVTTGTIARLRFFPYRESVMRLGPGSVRGGLPRLLQVRACQT